MRGQKEFLIVLPRIVLRLDVHEPELSGVSAPAQVGHGHDVSVHEPGAGWPWREPVAQVAMGRDREALLLFGAVHVRGNNQPVPMHQLGRVGVVEQVNRHRDALPQPDHRPGNLRRCIRWC